MKGECVPEVIQFEVDQSHRGPKFDEVANRWSAENVQIVIFAGKIHKELMGFVMSNRRRKNVKLIHGQMDIIKLA